MELGTSSDMEIYGDTELGPEERFMHASHGVIELLKLYGPSNKEDLMAAYEELYTAVEVYYGAGEAIDTDPNRPRAKGIKFLVTATDTIRQITETSGDAETAEYFAEQHNQLLSLEKISSLTAETETSI
jgi:hypothetical protein